MFKILRKKEWHPTITELWIEAPVVARKYSPGQFVVVRIDERGERIPLTVVNTDKKEGLICLIFQKVGKSTYTLGLKEPGDYITDVIGPMGRPTHLENLGTVACVGGGVGVAPLYPIARGYKEAGNELISIIGARTKDLIILEREMRAISDELIVTTDDGTYGMHGFVTDALKQVLQKREDVSLVVAIGPCIMMKFVAKTCEPFKVPLIVSLNSIMVDATGMCGACRVTVGGVTRFVCVEGPEFDGYKVDYDELMKRQSMYLKEEKIALERFKKEHPEAFSEEVC